jgi:ABC-type glycerol-3-phosphate transport system substrate-binding protein
MKKVILAASLLVILLTACGGGENQIQQAEAGDTVTVFYSPT